MPPAMVTFEVVAARDLPVEREYVGQTNGSREVEIRARVNGIIEKRLYEEGSVVKAGQALFRLDSATYAAAAAQAEAAVASAEANMKLAERDYARLKPLVEAKAISQKEWDTATSTLDVTRAQLKQAQAQLQAARVDLGYTDIRAPISGVVGRALKVEGALANASGDSLLATLAQTDPLHVNFTIAGGMPWKPAGGPPLPQAARVASRASAVPATSGRIEGNLAKESRGCMEESFRTGPALRLHCRGISVKAP